MLLMQLENALNLFLGRVQGKVVGGGVGMASATDYCFATKYASVKLSEFAIGIGPFVVGPAVERKIGNSAFSSMTINATKWFDAQWAREKGLFSDVFDSTEEMDKEIQVLASTLSNSNPQAMKELKEIMWKGTEKWDELLMERAENSGKLVLSDFTKNAIKSSRLLKMNDKIDNKILEHAFALMCKARAMSEIYEENSEVTSKYVHATSKGHEAIQIALGIQLTEHDWVAPYYRDDSILLSIGLSPYELMLQLLCKKDDPFSAGRTYYSHPSLNRKGFPKIPHQSSATGMQAIPTTGVAMGIQYKEKEGISKPKKGEEPVVVCSFGDASITEGEVAEAFQMASLKKLPILYLVQDNEWDISAHATETRAVDANTVCQRLWLKNLYY